MASSGVWENVILFKTTTFDGVCGMLSYNVFDILPKYFFDFLKKNTLAKISKTL